MAQGGQHEHANATTVHDGRATGSDPGRKQDWGERRSKEVRHRRELCEPLGVGRTAFQEERRHHHEDGAAKVEQCCSEAELENESLNGAGIGACQTCSEAIHPFAEGGDVGVRERARRDGNGREV